MKDLQALPIWYISYNYILKVFNILDLIRRLIPNSLYNFITLYTINFNN